MLSDCYEDRQRLAAFGRQGEVGNGRFVEFHCAKAGFGWATALEKADGPFWAHSAQ